jgi:hypothetical protein
MIFSRKGAKTKKRLKKKDERYVLASLTKKI